MFVCKFQATTGGCVYLWQYLDTLRQFIHENLRHLQHSPSVQMHDIPPDSINLDNLDEIDPDTRNDQEDLDRQ